MSASKEEFYRRQDIIFGETAGSIVSALSPAGTSRARTQLPRANQEEAQMISVMRSTVPDVALHGLSTGLKPSRKRKRLDPVHSEQAVSTNRGARDIPSDQVIPTTPDDGSILKSSKPTAKTRRKPLFSGLTFHFVPTSRINAARNVRMKKVEALGGIVSPTFDSKKVTHVIADHNITAKILLQHLGLHAWPVHVKVFNESWTPDCVIYGKLLEPTVKYLVDGHIAEGFTCAPAAIQEPASAPKSLQVRESKVKRAPEPNTDDGPSSISTAPASPHVPLVPSTPVFTASSDQAGTDELDGVISTVKALSTVHLSDESSASDEDDQKVSPEQMKYKTFKCMKGQGIHEKPPINTNDFVISKLQIMQKYYETSRFPEDKVFMHEELRIVLTSQWKPRSYRMAIASLRSQKEPITTYEEAIKLPHVGEKLAKHIVEIAMTGTFSRVDNIGADYDLVKRFMDIYGVGATKANQFVEQGYKTFQDLLENDVLNRNQKIGIELYDDLNTRIPRAEVEEIKKVVIAEGAKIDPSLQIYVMGSYRRGAADCGDVDFMLTRKNTSQPDLVALWQRLLNVLQDEQKFLTHALLTSDTKDGLKWQGVGKLDRPGSLHRRIDFLLVPWEQRGAALIYFTGNDLFNRSLRLLARKKGYTLNEKALMRGALRGAKGVKLTTGTNTGLETEEEIFACLGVPYRPPHERCVT